MQHGQEGVMTGSHDRPWQSDAHQETGQYETQGDHGTDRDNVVLPFE